MSVTRPGWMDLNEGEEPGDVVLPVEVRVKQGFALLDEKHGPEWVQRIDVDTLDLADTCHCVLGQLHPNAEEGWRSYDDGCRATGVDSLEDQQAGGFYVDGDRWYALTTAWRSAILARRLELAQAPC